MSCSTLLLREVKQQNKQWVHAVVQVEGWGGRQGQAISR
jgi:hypothetical protein